MKALVGRALRLQEPTSLESLAIQLDEWYRQCAAEYVPTRWMCEHMTPETLVGCTMPGGWRYVGYGHYSLAMRHSSRPDYIFKICCRADDGYPEYATWCVSKFNDGTHVDLCIPHIPFVHLVVDHVRIVPVQRLEKIYSGYTGNTELDYGELLDAVDAIKCCMRSMLGLTVYREEDECAVSPKMQATLKAIVQSFKGLRGVDIHSDNVMLNDNGEMILTDPLGYAGDTGTWRKTRRKNK